jgi:predicted ArsR family transcriptional regulator
VTTILKNSIRGLTVAQISEKLGVTRQRAHFILNTIPEAQVIATKYGTGRPAFIFTYVAATTPTSTQNGAMN